MTQEYHFQVAIQKIPEWEFKKILIHRLIKALDRSARTWNQPKLPSTDD